MYVHIQEGLSYSWKWGRIVESKVEKNIFEVNLWMTHSFIKGPIILSNPTV